MGSFVINNLVGIYIYKSSISLMSTKISNNAAGTKIGHGAGLYIFDSPVQMQECEVSSNTAAAGDGGGLYAYSSVANLMSIQAACSLYQMILI